MTLTKSTESSSKKTAVSSCSGSLTQSNLLSPKGKVTPVSIPQAQGSTSDICVGSGSRSSFHHGKRKAGTDVPEYRETKKRKTGESPSSLKKDCRPLPASVKTLHTGKGSGRLSDLISIRDEMKKPTPSSVSKSKMKSSELSQISFRSKLKIKKDAPPSYSSKASKPLISSAKRSHKPLYQARIPKIISMKSKSVVPKRKHNASQVKTGAITTSITKEVSLTRLNKKNPQMLAGISKRTKPLMLTPSMNVRKPIIKSILKTKPTTAKKKATFKMLLVGHEYQLIVPVPSHRKRVRDWISSTDRSLRAPQMPIERRILDIKRMILRKILHHEKVRPIPRSNMARPTRPVYYTGRTNYVQASRLSAQNRLVLKRARAFAKLASTLKLDRLPPPTRRTLLPVTDEIGTDRKLRKRVPVEPYPIINNRFLRRPKMTAPEREKYLTRKGLRLTQALSAFRSFFDLDLLRRDLKPRFQQKGGISRNEKQAQIKVVQFFLNNAARLRRRVELPVFEMRQTLQTLRKTPTRPSLSNNTVNVESGTTARKSESCALSLLKLISPKKMLMDFEQRLLRRNKDRSRIFSPTRRAERYENLKSIVAYLAEIEKSVRLQPRVWVRGSKVSRENKYSRTRGVRLIRIRFKPWATSKQLNLGRTVVSKKIKSSNTGNLKKRMSPSLRISGQHTVKTRSVSQYQLQKSKSSEPPPKSRGKTKLEGKPPVADPSKANDSRKTRKIVSSRSHVSKQSITGSKGPEVVKANSTSINSNYRSSKTREPTTRSNTASSTRDKSKERSSSSAHGRSDSHAKSFSGHKKKTSSSKTRPSKSGADPVQNVSSSKSRTSHDKAGPSNNISEPYPKLTHKNTELNSSSRSSSGSKVDKSSSRTSSASSVSRSSSSSVLKGAVKSEPIAPSSSSLERKRDLPNSSRSSGTDKIAAVPDASRHKSTSKSSSAKGVAHSCTSPTDTKKKPISVVPENTSRSSERHPSPSTSKTKPDSGSRGRSSTSCRSGASSVSIGGTRSSSKSQSKGEFEFKEKVKSKSTKPSSSSPSSKHHSRTPSASSTQKTPCHSQSSSRQQSATSSPTATVIRVSTCKPSSAPKEKSKSQAPVSKSSCNCRVGQKSRTTPDSKTETESGYDSKTKPGSGYVSECELNSACHSKAAPESFPKRKTRSKSPSESRTSFEAESSHKSSPSSRSKCASSSTDSSHMQSNTHKSNTRSSRTSSSKSKTEARSSSTISMSSASKPSDSKPRSRSASKGSERSSRSSSSKHNASAAKSSSEIKAENLEKKSHSVDSSARSNSSSTKTLLASTSKLHSSSSSKSKTKPPAAKTVSISTSKPGLSPAGKTVMVSISRSVPLPLSKSPRKPKGLTIYPSISLSNIAEIPPTSSAEKFPSKSLTALSTMPVVTYRAKSLTSSADKPLATFTGKALSISKAHSLTLLPLSLGPCPRKQRSALTSSSSSSMSPSIPSVRSLPNLIPTSKNTSSSKSHSSSSSESVRLAATKSAAPETTRRHLSSKEPSSPSSQSKAQPASSHSKSKDSSKHASSTSKSSERHSSSSGSSSKDSKDSKADSGSAQARSSKTSVPSKGESSSRRSSASAARSKASAVSASSKERSSYSKSEGSSKSHPKSASHDTGKPTPSLTPKSSQSSLQSKSISDSRSNRIPTVDSGRKREPQSPSSTPSLKASDRTTTASSKHSSHSSKHSNTHSSSTHQSDKTKPGDQPSSIHRDKKRSNDPTKLSSSSQRQSSSTSSRSSSSPQVAQDSHSRTSSRRALVPGVSVFGKPPKMPSQDPSSKVRPSTMPFNSKRSHSSTKCSPSVEVDEERLKMPPPKFLPPRARTRLPVPRPHSLVARPRSCSAKSSSAVGPASNSPTRSLPCVSLRLPSRANPSKPKAKTKAAPIPILKPKPRPKKVEKGKPKPKPRKVYVITPRISVHPGDIYRSKETGTSFVFSKSIKTVSETTLRILTTAYALKCSLSEYPSGPVELRRSPFQQYGARMVQHDSADSRKLKNKQRKTKEGVGPKGKVLKSNNGAERNISRKTKNKAGTDKSKPLTSSVQITAESVKGKDSISYLRKSTKSKERPIKLQTKSGTLQEKSRTSIRQSKEKLSTHNSTRTLGESLEKPTTSRSKAIDSRANSQGISKVKPNSTTQSKEGLTNSKSQSKERSNSLQSKSKEGPITSHSKYKLQTEAERNKSQKLAEKKSTENSKSQRSEKNSIPKTIISGKSGERDRARTSKSHRSTEKSLIGYKSPNSKERHRGESRSFGASRERKSTEKGPAYQKKRATKIDSINLKERHDGPEHSKELHDTKHGSSKSKERQNYKRAEFDKSKERHDGKKNCGKSMTIEEVAKLSNAFRTKANDLCFCSKSLNKHEYNLRLRSPVKSEPGGTSATTSIPTGPCPETQLLWRNRNYRTHQLRLAAAKKRSSRRHRSMLDRAAAFLFQTQTPSPKGLGSFLKDSFLNNVGAAKPSRGVKRVELEKFLDRMPSFSKIADYQRKGIPIERLDWESFLVYHQCPGCTLLSQSYAQKQKYPGVRIIRLKEKKAKGKEKTLVQEGVRIKAEDPIVADGLIKDEDVPIEDEVTVIWSSVPPDLPKPLHGIIKMETSKGPGSKKRVTFKTKVKPRMTLFKRKLNRTKGFRPMRLRCQHNQPTTETSGVRIQKNAEVEHSIELLRHRRLITRRLEILDTEHTIVGLERFPAFRPVPKSGLDQLAMGLVTTVPLGKRAVQQGFCEAVSMLLAHAGFTHASVPVLEVLSNVAEGFMKKIASKVKAAHELNAMGATHGFADPVERAITEVGIPGGLLGLREFYETRIIDYHRWLLTDCISLRSELATKIAIKVGYESKSSKTPTSVTTTNVTTDSKSSRADPSKQRLVLTNSSSTATPGISNVIGYPSPSGTDSSVTVRKGSSFGSLRHSIELNQGTLVRLNFGDELADSNSSSNRLVGSPAYYAGSPQV